MSVAKRFGRALGSASSMKVKELGPGAVNLLGSLADSVNKVKEDFLEGYRVSKPVSVMAGANHRDVELFFQTMEKYKDSEELEQRLQFLAEAVGFTPEQVEFLKSIEED